MLEQCGVSRFGAAVDRFLGLLRAGSLFAAAFAVMLPLSPDAAAHHILGRPSYSLNEDSNTPPTMQAEVEVEGYRVTLMVFPAFPRPGEPGRIHLYAVGMTDGAPYRGTVEFSVREDGWFDGPETKLGVQSPDDNVYRQGFRFDREGSYFITARLDLGGDVHGIDLPIDVGETSGSHAIVGVSLALIAFLALVSVLLRKRLLRAKIQGGRHSGAPGRASTSVGSSAR